MNLHDPRYRFGTSAVLASGQAAPAAGLSAKAALGERAKEIAASLSERSISVPLLTGLTRAGDFAALLLLGIAVYFFYLAPAAGIDWSYALPLVGGSVLAVILVQTAGGYHVPILRTVVGQFGRLFAAWTMVFATFAVIAFLTKSGDYFSRGLFAAWYAAGLGFFLVSRLALSSVVRGWTREGRLERRAVIVGGGRNAEELIDALERQSSSDIRICGIFDDRSDERSPPMVAGYPKIGNVADLVEFARVARIDLLIVSLPITAENRLLSVLKQLWVLPVDIRLSAHTNKLRFRPRAYSYVGAVPFLDVFDRPIADWGSFNKRVFDLVVATLALVLLSPIMLLTALAVKLDSPGPVFFRQKRYGFNNEIIDVFKFRSMYATMADPGAKVAVTRGDPRVTRVGRFIRKSSIDELPQLFNVIRGELSLVGPRPHAVTSHTDNRLWDEVVDGYFARHRVKPGVTGWAQINGWRGEADTPEKIRQRVTFDLYYIENWSILFDLQILALTPFRLFTSENAY